MKQTGTFHVYEIKNSQRVVSPIPNAFIYFVQNNSIKLTVKTDDKGKYSFDLPLGEYTVVSSSEGGIEQLLANGSKFILNAQSKVTAFEEWVNAPSADVDTALLKRFRELAKIAEDAAREANEALAQLEGNSIGTGKWMREGAYGVGSFNSQTITKEMVESTLESGFYVTRSRVSEELPIDTGAGALWHISYANNTERQFSIFIDSSKGGMYSRYTRIGRGWFEYYSTKNTRTDKNNVLHSGTSTPLTTLNTSDMVQDIVNRDDVTVTSGAVFRGLAKKWDIQVTTGTGNIIRKSELDKKWNTQTTTGTGNVIRASELNKYIPKSMPRSDQGWFAIKAVDSGGAALNFECATGFVRGNIIASKDDGISFRQFKEGDPLPLLWNMPLKSGRLLAGNTIGDGDFMQEGAYGLGTYISDNISSATSLFNASKNGFLTHGDIQISGMLQGASAYIVNNIGGASGGKKRKVVLGLEGTNSSGVMVRPNMYLGSTDEKGDFRFGWTKVWGEGNTTVDSNGFIKRASPIIRLFNDKIDFNEHFSEEPIFERIGEGTYKISNTLGLAQEGWTYEKPRGSDGQPYFRIVVEKLEDGCIVRVHDEYDTVEKAEITDIDGNTRTVDKIVKILGQARDIKDHERWIDLRFHEEPREEIEPTEVVQ